MKLKIVLASWSTCIHVYGIILKKCSISKLYMKNGLATVMSPTGTGLILKLSFCLLFLN